MTEYKDKLINEYLNKPFEVGEKVKVSLCQKNISIMRKS